MVEQDCVYQDMDDLDQDSIHLLSYSDDKLSAYARIIPPGKKFEDASIGRIVTAGSVRRSGMGKDLINIAIEYCRHHYPGKPIRISAQCYLNKFYTSFGFRTVSGKRSTRNQFTIDILAFNRDFPHLPLLDLG